MASGDISPETFHEYTIDFIDTHYDYAWTLKGKTSKGVVPVGFIFGVENNGIINIVEVIWLSWASTRNKIESALKFLSVIRNKHLLIMQVPHKEIKFMVRLCNYGMLHRAGTLLDVYDEPAPLFQTRFRKK